jgi:DNA-binding response OmpR family regulator
MAAIETPVTPAVDLVEEESGSVLRLVEPRALILSVSGSQTDHTTLRRIIADTQWRLAAADTCREARQKLPLIGPLVIFCECLLRDGTWKDVLKLVSDVDEPPFLVVTSRLADDFLWSEVLNLGGYDVLSKPLVADEVRQVLASIWTHRGHRVRRTRVLPAAS